jgi:hypothetical protein
MQLETILSVAVGVWIAVVLLVITMCRLARRNDDAMDTALAHAITAGPGAELTRAPSPERRLRTLSLANAATMLDVDPDTLLAWEARYGFPRSSPAEPRYSQSEVLALRTSLEEGLSIASAVLRAREQTRRRRPVTSGQLVDQRDGGLAS